MSQVLDTRAKADYSFGSTRGMGYQLSAGRSHEGVDVDATT